MFLIQQWPNKDYFLQLILPIFLLKQFVDTRQKCFGKGLLMNTVDVFMVN